jgi:hypothetical protein
MADQAPSHAFLDGGPGLQFPSKAWVEMRTTGSGARWVVVNIDWPPLAPSCHKSMPVVVPPRTRRLTSSRALICAAIGRARSTSTRFAVGGSLPQCTAGASDILNLGINPFINVAALIERAVRAWRQSVCPNACQRIVRVARGVIEPRKVGRVPVICPGRIIIWDRVVSHWVAAIS